ncbi:MAG: fibronectin type III domain-containing protein [Eubacterium sp.]
MKKLLSVILSILMVFSLPLTALAANGPMGSVDWGFGDIYLSYISLYDFDDNGNCVGYTPVFEENITYNSVNGVSYDKASNTLTLNNFKSSKAIETNTMGDDFKINVVGSCSVGQIKIFGDHYGGSLTIDGNGTLTVNQSKLFENAIVLNGEESDSSLNFGANVKVNLYAQTDTVCITGTSNKNASSAIKFSNGQTANVTKEPYAKFKQEQINAVILTDTEFLYGGEARAICASDPGGIYTISEVYKDGNMDDIYYWVNKYFYVEPFDAYTEDYSFGDSGRIEMTEEEFKNQTEFSFKLTQADYPEEIGYYEKDNLDADYYYSAFRLTNASDPNGIYGYYTYCVEDSEGNVIEEGVNINRFVLAEGTDKYIIDESFEQLSLTNEELESSDYSIVYAMEYEWLNWYGYIERNTYGICKDKSSNKYVVDSNGEVYDYVGKDIVNIGGVDYYCVTENNTVSADSLEASFVNEYIDGYYNYTLKGTQFIYTGGHTHTLKTTTTKATTSKDGKIVKACTKCGKTVSTTVIPKASSIKLSATSYTYDGKVKTPSVTVKDSKGKTLKKNTDYTVTYASGRKNVGQYAVKISFKGNYSGTKTLYFTIKPKATSISSVSAGSKKFTVKWKKQATQTTGYQIQYSTSSKFSKAKTVTVGKNSTTSKTVSKLSAKKKYYVRVRTYKTVKINGKATNIYSSWSKAKAVTTKK